MDSCGGGGSGLTYVPDLSPRSPHDGTAMRVLGVGLDGAFVTAAATSEGWFFCSFGRAYCGEVVNEWSRSPASPSEEKRLMYIKRESYKTQNLERRASTIPRAEKHTCQSMMVVVVVVVVMVATAGITDYTSSWTQPLNTLVKRIVTLPS